MRGWKKKEASWLLATGILALIVSKPLKAKEDKDTDQGDQDAPSTSIEGSREEVVQPKNRLGIFKIKYRILGVKAKIGLYSLVEWKKQSEGDNTRSKAQKILNAEGTEAVMIQHFLRDPGFRTLKSTLKKKIDQYAKNNEQFRKKTQPSNNQTLDQRLKEAIDQIERQDKPGKLVFLLQESDPIEVYQNGEKIITLKQSGSLSEHFLRMLIGPENAVDEDVRQALLSGQQDTAFALLEKMLASTLSVRSQLKAKLVIPRESQPARKQRFHRTAMSLSPQKVAPVHKPASAETFQVDNETSASSLKANSNKAIKQPPI